MKRMLRGMMGCRTLGFFQNSSTPVHGIKNDYSLKTFLVQVCAAKKVDFCLLCLVSSAAPYACTYTILIWLSNFDETLPIQGNFR